MKDLTAQVGDQLLIRRHRVGEPDRDAEILEVRGENGRPPYVVRWSDGTEGFVMPGSDAFVQPGPRASDS